MKRIFSQIFNIRKGEILITSLMFLYVYLVLVTYYFLKPARDSLFLSNIGWRQLPIVFMIIGLVAVLVNAFYAKAGRRLKLNKLINYTTLIIIICLIGLRWVVGTGSDWAMYVFYIWVSIYGALVPSQFWLFANVVYSPTQAKRLFVLLNLGGILGAFTGGEVTGIVIRTFNVQTENLLFFCIGFLVICMFLINAIWALKKKEIEETPVRQKKEEQKENISQIFNSIKSSRHLLLLIGIIAMTMITGTFVDTQFKGVTQEYFQQGEIMTDVEKSEMTVFLGKFYGRLSLISLVLQMLFTYRFIRILGVGGIIGFLPAGLFLGSLSMLFIPGLFSGVLLRGSDGCFKYSLDKTGRELLFLPVPLAIKKRTKIFIDVVVDRISRAAAGGLLLISIAAGFSIQQLSVIVVILLIIWLFFVIMIRKEYVNAFRKALEKREIDIDELTIKIDDTAAVRTLIETLKSDNHRQVDYSLELLKSAHNIDLSPDVLPLLDHKSPEIRRKSIQVLMNQTSGPFLNEIENKITDSSLDVQLEAMRYVFINSGENRLTVFSKFFEEKDIKIKAVASVCIAENGTEEDKRLLDENIVKELITAEAEISETCRSLTARALGALNRPEYRKYLMELINDEKPKVNKTAVIAAGQTKDREFVQILLKKLEDKKSRKEAREALAAYGNRILGTLGDYLTDKSVNILLRRNIPKILSGIPTQETVNFLTSNITTIEPSLKYHLIKALNKIRSNYPDLNINKEKLNDVVILQTREYYETLKILEVQKKEKSPEDFILLEKALNEKLDQNLEEIFRLLGLWYPSNDIYSAYQGIISSKKALRASAVEFLDNVLNKNLKKYLLPIVDTEAADIAITEGQKLFDLSITNTNDALMSLIQGSDSWLKSCAIYYVSNKHPDDMKVLVEKAASDDHDPLAKETARYVLEREWGNKK